MEKKEAMVVPERETRLWDPFREMRAMAGIGDLFEDFLGGWRPFHFPALTRAWMPKVDIQETDKEYHLTVALPGVKKEDVKVSVEDDVLRISGEKKEEKEERGKAWVRRESSYGSFERSFVLPGSVHPEDMKASFKDGQLLVTLRKPEKPRSRGVSVKID